MNHEKCLELRNTHTDFYYKSFNVEETHEEYVITFHFLVPELAEFRPCIKIEKKMLVNTNMEYINFLAFHIGLVELISYWKCTCSPNVIVEAGSITGDQITWFLKMYYHGLGEFFYVNGITLAEDDFMNIICNGPNIIKPYLHYHGTGNLIAIGGGKDSSVALEVLAGEDNICTMMNPKEPGIECMKVAGYDEYIKYTRTIDPNLLELNDKGYLNGHTPFNALVAFTTYLVAYLSDKKHIVLSNEGSANEETVIGTNINHQYSKSYEFENDFREYSDKYLGGHIEYFSLLRCLNELQVALIFSQYKKYHSVFKSCNVGSKSAPWIWCRKCPKCLFVFIILSPFLTEEELINIFGSNLYEDDSLLDTFKELLGYGETKPFECVGTIGEIRYAVSLAVDKFDKLPYLLKFYKENYPLELDVDYIKAFNEEHNIKPEFLKKLEGELKKYV